MADRRYQPGQKVNKFRAGNKYSPNRVAWVNTATVQIALMRYPEGSLPEGEKPESSFNSDPGPTFALVFQFPKVRYPISISLGVMTVHEVKALQAFLNAAFELAEPIATERDRKAEDAYQNGDDSYTRLYRQLPQLVIREGPLREDEQGVLQRLNSVLGGNAVRGAVGDRIQRERDEVANQEPPNSSTQDDGSETDQP